MKRIAPLRDWPEKYPNLPIWISLTGLATALIALLVKVTR